MDLKSALQRYTLRAQVEGLSPKSITHTNRVLTRFGEMSGGIPDIAAVTADHLRKHILALQEGQKWAGRADIRPGHGKVSGTSINTYVRAIRAFWGWLEREKLIPANPMAEVRPPKLPRRMPKVLTEQQLEDVFRLNLSDRDRAMLMVFIDSGIRLSELTNLMYDHFSDQDRSLMVVGKGDKERRVFVSETTRNWLVLYMFEERPTPKSENRLFLNRDGTPMKPARVSRLLSELGEKARLKQRLSPHKLRHTHATLSLKHGANLEILRREMGHCDVSTTQIYLNLTDSDTQQAHRQFSPIVNLFGKGLLINHGWVAVVE